jgi:hypothetical protein
MKKLVATLGVLACCTAAFAKAPVAVAGPRAPVQPASLTATQRGQLLNELVSRWAEDVEANGGSSAAWRSKLTSMVGQADARNLTTAVEMPTYETAMAMLQGQPLSSDSMGQALLAAAAGRPKVFGSVVSDTVFTPLPNGRCRVADSRVIESPTVAATVRAINVDDTADYSAQGGNGSTAGQGSTNCGIPVLATAYVASVTVLPVGQDGFFKIYQNGKAFSEGNTLLYTANAGASNDVIVRACQDCTEELSVYSNASTHYVVDIIGYFMPPQATALECVDASSPATAIPANSGVPPLYSPSCPVGYTITGGSCTTSSFMGRVVSSHTMNSPQQQMCVFANENFSMDISGTAIARCCRVPGG